MNPTVSKHLLLSQSSCPSRVKAESDNVVRRAYRIVRTLAYNVACMSLSLAGLQVAHQQTGAKRPALS